LFISQDGKIVRETLVSLQGNFREVFSNLPRGTYTWGVSVEDPNVRRTGTYNTTIYLIARTSNLVAPIYVSPTIAAASSTLALGDPLVLSGYSIPLIPVQVIVNKQGEVETGKIITATTTANGNGSWSISIPTDTFLKGTYEAKALALVNSKDVSLLSPTLYIGAGEDPTPDFSQRSDLNKDTRVNLIDFSILLFHWKSADPIADINQDGTVSLIDFSIMLANWTG
jgi:hypothetical protein